MTGAKRIERIGNATLYLGDCREILPTLTGVDAIVTDPPYELTSGGNTEGLVWKGKLFGTSDYKNDGRIVALCLWEDWLPLVYQACADDADIYVMANDKNVLDAMKHTAAAGFGFHNLLVWHKVSSVPNRWYFKNCEFTVYGWKGKAKTIRNPSSGQLFNCPRENGAHPTQKPIALMEHYVGNSTDVDGTVCDPFLGSGTTGVACARLGRRFIGIELDPRHFDTACRRIEGEQRQANLFAPIAPQPRTGTPDMFAGIIE